ncbi:hypothetical protein CFK39_06220 [Brachybacterium avium]|uniref:Uncharacterized protein n=1 Tax=Brachybacterium avium TaxID=2017485 RepID=A0A220UFZ9_9MICO|nr:hypothetical protein [Brachybacterium avium]ASK67077.1 hypothetical protein CFK39_06220 [Brachybacterium avium]
MFTQLQHSRLLRRAKPGDGSALQDLRWWQLLTRTQFFLDPDEHTGRTAPFTVDVRFLAAELEGGKIAAGAHHAPVALYRDGRQLQIANPPVAFAVPGGAIEVATSMYGLTRMHHVPDSGQPRALRPHPRSLEGRRARFSKDHPRTSRAIGAAAILVLLAGLVVMLPQLAEMITTVEVVAARVGTFTSPIQLPTWANTALLIAGALAATERALTLRNHWLIDADTTWASLL